MSKRDAISKAVVRRRIGDGKYRVLLSVGVQSFSVGDPPVFDDNGSRWFRTMLIRALRRLVDDAKKENSNV